MIEIEVNQDKCKSPRECRKCLEVCTEGVFMNHPRVGRRPGKKTEDWAIRPLFLSMCTACKICENICPVNAITVSMVG